MVVWLPICLPKPTSSKQESFKQYEMKVSIYKHMYTHTRAMGKLRRKLNATDAQVNQNTHKGKHLLTTSRCSLKNPHKFHG